MSGKRMQTHGKRMKTHSKRVKQRKLRKEVFDKTTFHKVNIKQNTTKRKN